MRYDRTGFGVLSTGERVSIFLLELGPLRASFSDYGATLVSLLLPRAKGLGDDIVLGFPTLSGYAGKHPCFGATVGRFAGRIASARFMVGDREYPLAANDGTSCIHGGVKGFHRHVWRAEAYAEGGEPRLRMTRRSPDGEEGFPGNLDVSVEFGLTAKQELLFKYEAATDAATPINLTNHSYFNLRGAGYGGLASHEIRLAASRYLESNAELLPTGRMLPVEGSVFDLKTFRRIGAGLEELGGYDHCFEIDRDNPGLVECAEVREPESGRRMIVSTTCPGVQFYTGNFLSGEIGKDGMAYERHGGFCLETQYFPDAVHHRHFPSVMLEPGRTWREESRFGFSWT